MPGTPTNLTAGSGTAATSFNTASVDPPDDQLVTISIAVLDGSAIAAPTVTGNGLTWELQSGSGSAADVRRLFLFRAVGTASAGAINIDFGVTIDSCVWSVNTHPDTIVSNNGADAFVQVVNRDQDSLATARFVKLQNRVDANNGFFAVAVVGQSEAIGIGTGWTELSETQGTSATLEVMFQNAAEVLADVSWTTSGHSIMLACELAHTGSADAPPIRVVKVTDVLTGGPTVFTTASITPTADALMLLFFSSVRANDPRTPTSVVGNGLTWTLITSVDFTTIASPDRRLLCYAAKGAAPSAGTVVITQPVNHSNGRVLVLEVTGIDTAETAVDLIVQSATARVDAATALAATLAAFADTRNGTIVAMQSTDATLVYPTVEDGLVLVEKTNPTDKMSAAWRWSNDTTPGYLVFESSDVGLIALEVTAEPSTGSPVEVDATPATATVQAQAATPLLGEKTVAAAQAQIAAQAQAATVTRGVTTIAAAPATLSTSAQAATVTPAAKTVNATPTMLTAAAQAAVVTPAEKTIAATPAVVAVQPQAATVDQGGSTIVASPAVLAVSAQAITFDLGVKTVAATFASLSLLAQAAQTTVEGFVSQVPDSVVSNDGWDTGPTPGGDLVAALVADDSDFITVTV